MKETTAKTRIKTIRKTITGKPIVGKVIIEGKTRIRIKRDLGDNEYLCDVYKKR